MKVRTFGGVEFIDVVRGDEIDLGALGEGARFIEDEPATFHAGAQCVRHSLSLARRTPGSSGRRMNFNRDEHTDEQVMMVA